MPHLPPSDLAQDQPFVLSVTISPFDSSTGYATSKLYVNGQLQSSTQHSRVTAAELLTYAVDLGTAHVGWSSDRSAYGFQGNMYYFAAYTQQLSAADVSNEFNLITSCPPGPSFSMSTFQCSITSATKVAMDSFVIATSDRLAFKTCVSVTLTFTPVTSIPSGGTITLTYPSGFFASSVTPIVAAGASSVAGLTATCSATTATSFVITTSGASISSSAFTITIKGLTMGAATKGAVGITVSSSADPVESLPVASGAVAADGRLQLALVLPTIQQSTPLYTPARICV